MEHVYTAVGRAVIAAQRFETALVPMFEFFRMVSDSDYLERTKGYVTAGKFKVPTATIVKLLAEKGDIAPDLEGRLNRYVEDRHLLIHRWIVERGWPDSGDVAGFAPLIALARRVEDEANTLNKNILGYLLKYTSAETVQSHAEYLDRVADLFNRGLRGEE